MPETFDTIAATAKTASLGLVTPQGMHGRILVRPSYSHVMHGRILVRPSYSQGTHGRILVRPSYSPWHAWEGISEA